MGRVKLNPAVGEETFRAEDVTKEFRTDRALLHAWTDEKMFEYLTNFQGMLASGWLK